MDDEGRRLTSGCWNRADAPIYFRASFDRPFRKSMFVDDPRLRDVLDKTPAMMSLWYHYEFIVANDLWERWLDKRWPLLLDSGVFTLYMRMLRRTGRKWGDVPASEFVVEDDPNWKRLVDTYDKVFSDPEVTGRMWGAIEVDIGDWGMKRRRRESMEDKYGIGFIPVFHVGSDPWTYLDFLMERYDRIAIGFIYVRRQGRDRWLLELFDRLDGSDVWVHLLAVSPEQCRTFVPHSMDSTRWQFARRGNNDPVAATLFSDLSMPPIDHGFRHQYGTRDYRVVDMLSLEAYGCRAMMLKRFRGGRLDVPG